MGALVHPSQYAGSRYGLALDCAQRHALGKTVRIEITAWDETNTRIRAREDHPTNTDHGGRALVALVGVQTNQFPRAVDIARPLRAAGIPVCIGGFHVSGCLAMLPDLPPEMQEASIWASPCSRVRPRGRLDDLLRAAYRDELKPLYNFMSDLPDLEGAAVPYLPIDVVRRTSGVRTSFDAGRGCPFAASARSSTCKDASPDCAAPMMSSKSVRQSCAGRAQLLHHRRQPCSQSSWEADIRPTDQDARRGSLAIGSRPGRYDGAQDRGFIEKAGRAGINRVFIGMESINPECAEGSEERSESHHRVSRDATSVASRAPSRTLAISWAFPADTPASIERDIRIIQRELPIDLLEFFILVAGFWRITRSSISRVWRWKVT